MSQKAVKSIRKTVVQPPYVFLMLCDVPKELGAVDGHLMIRLARHNEAYVWRYQDGVTDRPLCFVESFYDSDGGWLGMRECMREMHIGDRVKVDGGMNVPGRHRTLTEIGTVCRISIFE